MPIPVLPEITRQNQLPIRTCGLYPEQREACWAWMKSAPRRSIEQAEPFELTAKLYRDSGELLRVITSSNGPFLPQPVAGRSFLLSPPHPAANR